MRSRRSGHCCGASPSAAQGSGCYETHVPLRCVPAAGPATKGNYHIEDSGTEPRSHIRYDLKVTAGYCLFHRIIATQASTGSVVTTKILARCQEMIKTQLPIIPQTQPTILVFRSADDDENVDKTTGALSIFFHRKLTILKYWYRLSIRGFKGFIVYTTIVYILVL